MSENFSKDNDSQKTEANHEANKSMLPEFILYYQLYDVTRKKMLFDCHNLKYTELNSQKLKNEATRNILKIMSSPLVKNKEFLIASKQQIYKWMYTCNKQNLLQIVLFVGEEEPKLTKKYLQYTEKQYQEYKIGTTPDDLKQRFVQRNVQMHELRGSSGQRDIEYALNRMKDIIVDAESYQEDVNELDEKTKQIKDKAQNVQQNASEIRQLSEAMDNKMKILIVVVCVIVAIIIGVFLFMKLKKNIIASHQTQNDALKDLEDHKHGDPNKKMVRLARKLNKQYRSKARLLVQQNYDDAYRALQNQQILEQYYTRRSIFHQIIIQFITHQILSHSKQENFLKQNFPKMSYLQLQMLQHDFLYCFLGIYKMLLFYLYQKEWYFQTYYTVQIQKQIYRHISFNKFN